MVLHQIFSFILFDTGVYISEERQSWETKEFNKDANALEKVSTHFHFINSFEHFSHFILVAVKICFSKQFFTNYLFSLAHLLIIIKIHFDSFLFHETNYQFTKYTAFEEVYLKWLFLSTEMNFGLAYN